MSLTALCSASSLASSVSSSLGLSTENQRGSVALGVRLGNMGELRDQDMSGNNQKHQSEGHAVSSGDPLLTVL